MHKKKHHEEHEKHKEEHHGHEHHKKHTALPAKMATAAHKPSKHHHKAK